MSNTLQCKFCAPVGYTTCNEFVEIDGTMPFICTRQKGHEGDHVACSRSDNPEHAKHRWSVWTQKVEEEHSIDWGGPAFPENDGMGCVHMGMFLRDYFAAKAMQGMITAEWNLSREWDSSKTSEHAYRIADAMLVARQKP